MNIKIDDFCEGWIKGLLEEAFSYVSFDGTGYEAYAWIMDEESIDVEVTRQDIIDTEENQPERQHFRVLYSVEEKEDKYQVAYKLREWVTTEQVQDSKGEFHDCCEGTYVTDDIGERAKGNPKQENEGYKKNYVYWDNIDGEVEELVDYMIRASHKTLKYDPDFYDEPEEYSVPTEIVMDIACDVRDFLVNLLEKDYGCYFPPLIV